MYLLRLSKTKRDAGSSTAQVFDVPYRSIPRAFFYMDHAIILSLVYLVELYKHRIVASRSVILLSFFFSVLSFFSLSGTALLLALRGV